MELFFMQRTILAKSTSSFCDKGGKIVLVMVGMVLLSLAVGSVFIKINRCSKLEIVAIILFSVEIVAYYVGSVLGTQELIEIRKGEWFFAFRIAQYTLVPLSMLIYVNLFRRLSHWLEKLGFILLWTVLSVSGEYGLEQLGLFHYVDYPLWVSICFWIAMQVITLSASHYFQRHLLRGDPHV